MMKIEDIDALLPQPYRTLDRHLSGPVTRNVLFAPGDYFSRDQVRGVVADVLADVEVRSGKQGDNAPSIPPGWTIKRSGEEILITCPASGPGSRHVQKGVGSHESRMLYALADAMLGTPATDGADPT